MPWKKVIKWPSEDVMLETIGYLASKGVVKKIEAQVTASQIGRFKEKYKGHFSNEFPYPQGDKFGVQLRLVLNDSGDCPEFLGTLLDKTYGDRLNNTDFVQHLVFDYGFRITNAPQNSEYIMEMAKSNLTEAQLKKFSDGYNLHDTIITGLKKTLSKKTMVNPILVEPYVLKGTKKKGRPTKGHFGSAYTEKQRLNIGWLGEKYIYTLLNNGNKKLLHRLGIVNEDFQIEWFNEGFEEGEWNDKSVGKGYDIEVTVKEGSKTFKTFIEVKTSIKSGYAFTMTHKEMLAMQKERMKYYIIKLNYFEKVLKKQSPELIVYSDPYEAIFKPEMMKEATFFSRRQ